MAGNVFRKLLTRFPVFQSKVEPVFLKCGWTCPLHAAIYFQWAFHLETLARKLEWTRNNRAEFQSAATGVGGEPASALLVHPLVRTGATLHSGGRSLFSERH